MHPTPHKFTLIFIINGEDVRVEVSPEAQLHVARDKALAESHNTGRPASEWEIRNERGKLLDPAATIEAEHLHNGARLFLTLKVGAGGA